MKVKYFLFVLALSVSLSPAFCQTEKKCCDEENCKLRATDYATQLTGLVNFLGNCSDDQQANEATLINIKNSRPDIYKSLVEIVKVLDDYFFNDQPGYSDPDCFTDVLPTINKSNVLRWVNHIRFHILQVKPTFPSTEFCAGPGRRIEIAQGAAAFLSKTKMAYLGSLRGYLIYTFKGKNKCGGTVRLMAGPGFFLRSSDSYITLSSRLSVRLKDLRPSVFSLGNINLFGGYNNNFSKFSYAEGGFEVELGPFGINLSANYNTHIKKFGFLAGLVLANKKF